MRITAGKQDRRRTVQQLGPDQVLFDFVYVYPDDARDLNGMWAKACRSSVPARTASGPEYFSAELQLLWAVSAASLT